MKNQALSSSKDKSEKKIIKCRLLQFLFCAFWVKRARIPRNAASGLSDREKTRYKVYHPVDTGKVIPMFAFASRRRDKP